MISIARPQGLVRCLVACAFMTALLPFCYAEAASHKTKPQVSIAAIPGTLREQTQVDQNGAFNFTIPIDVPPGTGGMQPHLALAYNSQASSGVLGMGWSLTGLPTIERTKRTLAVDGVNGTIAYDANDRFTLQGQRLIVTNGQYGADASLYRTEVESWNEVTTHATAGSGPQWFSVRARDGHSYQFGNTPDSRIAAAGRPDIRSWMVNQITDANGNSMSASYSTDPLATGKSDYRGYVVAIAFTTNGSTAATRFVRFKYEANPEAQRIFIGGSEVDTNARLSHIQTFVGTNMVSDYRLTYEMSTATNRSRLKSVARYASDAAEAAQLSPATFTYSEGALAFQSKSNWLSNAFSRNQGWDGTTAPFTLADVNGDGFLDIVGFKDGVQVALGGPGQFQAPTQWINDFSSKQGWVAGNKRLLGDISGHGRADIVAIFNNGVQTAVSTGTGFVKTAGTFPYFSPTQGWTSDMPVFLVDVNGDHMMDLVGIKNATVYVALAKGDGTFEIPQVWLDKFGQPGANYQAADLNGDGNTDLFVVDNTYSVTVALSTGHSFDTSGWKQQGYKNLCGSTPITPKNQIMVSDVNGDGLADIVAFCDKVYVTLSTGQGFNKTEVWNTSFAGPNWSAGNLRMMADLNGDGMADLVGVTSNGVIAAPSNGHSFLDNIWNNSSLPWGLNGGGSATVTTRLMGDANADGLTDMVGIGDTNVYAGIAAGPTPDLMTAAVRSAGGSYAVAYAPLSDHTVYSESKAGALAQFQNFSPLTTGATIPTYRSAAHLAGFYHVVKNLTVNDNPAVGQTAFSYSHQMTYQDGKLDLTGRGWLGFAAVTTDSGGRKRKISQFVQDFPFIGKQSLTTTYDLKQTPDCSGNPVPYAATATQYTQIQTGSGTAPQSTPIYFVGKIATQDQAYQNCAVAHRVGTSYAYDTDPIFGTFGNVVLRAKLNLVDSSGTPVDPSKTVYTLMQYANDPSAWHFGTLLYSKVSKSNDPSNIQTFKDGVDLSIAAWSYDSHYNVLTQGKWDDGNKQYLTTSYSYDGFGNRLTTTTPSGSVSTMAYDPTYNTYPVSRTVVTAPGKSLFWSYGYDPRFGGLSVTRDPNNVSKTVCFDAFGRTAARQGPYPDNRSSGSFDPSCASGLVVGTAAPSNIVTLVSRTYGWSQQLPGVTSAVLSQWPQASERPTTSQTQYLDGLWRKSQLVSINPNESPSILSQLAYTEKGKVIVAAVPYFQGSAVRFITNSYDVLGRPIETDMPFGPDGSIVSVNQKSYVATSSGQTVTTTRAVGTSYASSDVATMIYRNNRAMASEIAMQGGSADTSFQYDLLGRRLSLIAPPGQDGTSPTYSYTYDSIGRLKTRTEPTRGTTTLAYDMAGNLQSQTRSQGSTAYQYDLIGRRLNATDSDGSARYFAYDEISVPFGQGRRTSAGTRDGAGAVQSTSSFAYDAFGHPHQVALGVSSLSASYTTSRDYDPVSRLATIGNPDSSSVSRQFSGHRLSSVALAGGPGATYANFTPTGTPRRTVYSNGVVTTTTLEIGGELYELKIADASGRVLVDRIMDWDQLGRLLSVSDNTTQPATLLQSYSYDGLRLVSAQDALSGKNWAILYDNAGNMTAYDGATYVYSGTKAVSASGGNGFSAQYGPMGAMSVLTPAGQDPLHLTSDMHDRLIAAKRDHDAAGSRYLYDADGRRILSVMPDGSSSVYVSRWYIDARSTIGSNPVRVLSRDRNPFLQWGTTSGDQSQFFLSDDHLNSTILTTGAAGASIASFRYSPLGELLGTRANLPRFLFTGKELDPYIGFYWMGGRAFHPVYGRFSAADSQLGGPPSRLDALNDNAYVLNSPASYYDPSGHWALALASGACWVAGEGVGAYGAAVNNTPAEVVGNGIGAVCGIISVVDALKMRAAAQVLPAPGGGGAPPPPPGGAPPPPGPGDGGAPPGPGDGGAPPGPGDGGVPPGPGDGGVPPGPGGDGALPPGDGDVPLPNAIPENLADGAVPADAADIAPVASAPADAPIPDAVASLALENQFAASNAAASSELSAGGVSGTASVDTIAACNTSIPSSAVAAADSAAVTEAAVSGGTEATALAATAAGSTTAAASTTAAVTGGAEALEVIAEVAPLAVLAF
jgi:RHS repeat-associated protein